MRQANLYAAKAELSELVQSALDGEEEGIARTGKPLVHLVPGTPSHSLCGRGSLRLDPASIDPPFTAEVEGQVVKMFHGESQG
jgi:antitoxin (DNA-binding transcriptional repressor) of toxin-antitoxin stability system